MIFQIIQLLKKEKEIDLTLAHVNFDGKGCPETTYDRNSPLQSPVKENVSTVLFFLIIK